MDREITKTARELFFKLPYASALWIGGGGGALVGLAQVVGPYAGILTWRQWVAVLSAAAFVGLLQLYHHFALSEMRFVPILCRTGRQTLPMNT